MTKDAGKVLMHFVMGFVFDRAGANVALIRKKSPEWMKGFLNGIGGKVEAGESLKKAMYREFGEETGTWIPEYRWKHTLTFICPGGTVFCFMTKFPHLDLLESKTDETAVVVPVDAIARVPIMNNLLWIIPLQLAEANFPILLTQNHLSKGINKDKEKKWKEK